MIISKPYGTIYVAIPKTASQSLSFALEASLKADDTPHEAESLNDWHATLREAEAITPLPLENYWSFAVVRNPFDRFISYCAGHIPDFHLQPQMAIEQAVEEVREGNNRWLWPQMDFLDGVRKIYRYERMNEALADIEERLGVTLGDMPRLNTSERDGYSGYYDDALRGKIAELYKSDLIHLDYRF